VTERGQVGLFGGRRIQMDESIALTIDSLNTYGPRHDHWAIAWSGGKDSSTLLTLVMHLLASGKVARPKTLTVLYADTRLELLPLWLAAKAIREELAEEHGVVVRTVMAPLDKRFLVYVLGRGVPPPNNNTLRWCTRQIKVDPMADELRRLHADRGAKVLTLTGVREGESAIRDNRIAMSCGRNGAECGQGWYQETLPEALTDTLAPLLHWRVCHVWEWLRHWAPRTEFGDWSTEIIADAYGGDEAEELNARTGCVGCPLAQKDTALDALCANPSWSYLEPLKKLRPLWRELRDPSVRKRKRGVELTKDGKIGKNPQRMGPVTLEARAEALERVLAIQNEVNAAARALGRPFIDILNAEEEARIRELLAAGTWPQKWSDDDAAADEVFDEINADGTVQAVLPMFEGEDSP
jgi:DNA sulfur modification protein DndC